MNERQLKWVQQSKTMRQRDARVDDLAKECVQALGRGGPAWRQRLIGVLFDEAGPALLDHAEPISISRGVLTFRVAEAAAAYHLRMQWEQHLLQLIAARLPQAGIHTIRFSAGA
jgi:hypothetical protein